MKSQGNTLRTGALTLLLAATTACQSQRSFSSPEAAASALADAVASEDRAEVKEIFGPRADELRSGDPDQDRRDRVRFSRALAARHDIRLDSDDTATLLIGEDAWPFAVPLVRGNGGWRFDTDAGLDELATRRIGRNELMTIQACLTLIDAQREYYTADRDGDGVLEYAQTLLSAPGQKDGLYWDAGPGGLDPSPIGPAFAMAAMRTDIGGERLPFHGYRYKPILRRAAPGGVIEFSQGGNLTGGWAAVAYPAEYAVSGVMSFLMSHGGEVFETDLGPDTASIVGALDTFDPQGWNRVGSGAN